MAQHQLKASSPSARCVVLKTLTQKSQSREFQVTLLRNGGRRGKGALETSLRSLPSLFLWEMIMVHDQHSRFSTSNLFSARKPGLPHPELEQHHQSSQFFRSEGIILKHQTRAPAPWLGHFPCFSPSSPHNPSKCLPHWLSGKCDEFDQEKKNVSPNSIKFCGCPERRWSLDSSRIYDCKQTVILLHNCPIALLWNILKFYGIEKVSIF